MFWASDSEQNMPDCVQRPPVITRCGSAGRCPVCVAWPVARQYWHRNGAAAFLAEALVLLPAGWQLRCVRDAGGFFEDGLLIFLEGRGWHIWWWRA